MRFPVVLQPIRHLGSILWVMVLAGEVFGQAAVPRPTSSPGPCAAKGPAVAAAPPAPLINGTNVRSRIVTGRAMPQPAVGTSVRTTPRSCTRQVGLGSPLLTNVPPAIINPSAGRSISSTTIGSRPAINRLTPTAVVRGINPGPGVGINPGPGTGRRGRPRYGNHMGAPADCAVPPTWQPVFMAPVYPAYAPGTYVVAEPVVQQSFLVIAAPPAAEPVAQRQEAAGGRDQPPGQPARNQIRNVAAQQDQEHKRGVARVGEDELHRLMLEGTRAFAAGDYEESAKCFFRVAMADKANVDGALAYALVRFSTGDYSTSALAIRRGVQRFPQVVDSAFDVRTRYGKLADFDKHLARLEEFVRQHPDDVDAWLVLGFVRHFSGQRELAARTFALLKRQSRQDLGLVDIFLEAKPLPGGEDQPPGNEAGKAKNGASPILPSLLAVQQRREAGLRERPLITAEPAQ